MMYPTIIGLIFAAELTVMEVAMDMLHMMRFE